MALNFPITVNSIVFDNSETYRGQVSGGGRCGDFVAVRPCDKDFDGKTFLGVFIGSIPLSQGVEFDPKRGELTIIRYMYNPVIFIPDRACVEFGCGSWWQRIKGEKHLNEITQADLENVWYVKALKWLAEASTPSTNAANEQFKND